MTRDRGNQIARCGGKISDLFFLQDILIFVEVHSWNRRGQVEKGKEVLTARDTCG